MIKQLVIMERFIGSLSTTWKNSYNLIQQHIKASKLVTVA